MCRITGVFNNEKAVELVIKALEALKVREDADFWICTENGDFYAKDLQELKQRATLKLASKQCIACCSCNPLLPRKGFKNRFVADAEIYNLDEIKAKYHSEGATSPEVLAGLIENALLDERVEGAYAYVYWIRDATQGDEVQLARDILGLKPICFAHTDGFAFASEKKALEAMGYLYAIELDPRILLRYNIEEDRLSFVKRAFFEEVPPIKEEKEEIKGELLKLLRASIGRRIPRGEKFGVLFSGGLDSSLIAYLCKDLGADFSCYTAAVEDPEMKEAEDLVYARSITADLGLELKIKRIQVEDIEHYLNEVVPLIDDTRA